MKTLLLSAAIFTSVASHPVLHAQAPGVPIERNGNRKQDSDLLNKAKALKDAGKLKLSIDVVKEQLKNPIPAAIEFPAARKERLSPPEVAKAARKAQLQLGWYYLCQRCDHWHLNLAAAYAVANDAIATCHHCVEPGADMREGYLIAVDHNNEVLPVTSVMAKSQTLDGAILRLEGSKLAPLPLNDVVSPGEPAYCFSTPLGQAGYFSEGIVNRFFWQGTPGKEGTAGMWKNLRLNVSTDWAPGSSGAAILDQAGNAIGHVSTIHPLSEGPRTKQSDEKAGAKTVDRFGGATLITLHAATPARGMMELAQPLRDFKPGDKVAVEKSSPGGEPGSLKIGSPAPELQTGKWVQGEPVKSFEKGKVYVVEFWATWCGPCRATIPHLNELHKKFADKGVVVIGQNCWEQDTEKVAPFIKEMGGKMTYRVALDAVEGEDPNTGAMATKWMQAAGQKGIPSAFLIDQKGVVAWIGHPSQLTDKTIDDVLEGKFDIAKSKAAADTDAKTREAMMRHGVRTAKALADKNWPDAEKSASDFEAALPDGKKYIATAMQFRIAVSKRDGSAANDAARKLASSPDTDSAVSNEIAWALLTEKVLEKPDLEVAEKLARHGVEKATGNSKAAVTDTLARALFRMSKKEEALKTQEEAIGSTSDEKLKASLIKTLEAYKRGELPADE